MPYTNTPWVRQGQVEIFAEPAIRIDTAGWFAWLHEVASFCYSSQRYPLRLTVRREQRRQQSYWYGYCKSNAKLHNVYLGKSEQLTQARLEQACHQLWQQIKKEVHS